MYWIFTTKVPLPKIIPLSKFISQFTWFHGIRVRDDNFPRGLATIEFRAKQMDSDIIEAFFDKIFSDLPPLYNKIQIYHAPGDKDTWKFAHLPKITSKRSNGISTYKNGVLILGKDSTPEHLFELLNIKKLLVGKGYKKTKLLKSIEDVSSQSLPQKLRLWGLLTRFSIIVDREPAGHLSEFEMLKIQDTVIAVLRPKGFKSTFMMEPPPKSNLIRIFEFDDTPIEKIDDVINWAERVTKENEKYYNKEYDWRKAL